MQSSDQFVTQNIRLSHSDAWFEFQKVILIMSTDQYWVTGMLLADWGLTLTSSPTVVPNKVAGGCISSYWEYFSNTAIYTPVNGCVSYRCTTIINTFDVFKYTHMLSFSISYRCLSAHWQLQIWSSPRGWRCFQRSVWCALSSVWLFLLHSQSTTHNTHNVSALFHLDANVAAQTQTENICSFLCMCFNSCV